MDNSNDEREQVKLLITGLCFALVNIGRAIKRTELTPDLIVECQKSFDSFGDRLFDFMEDDR